MSSIPPPTPPPMQAMPVLPDRYRELYNGRPGAILFVGILGIIVAVFGLLFTAYVMLVVSVIVNASRATATLAVSSGNAPAWTVAGGSQIETHQVFSDTQRQVVMNALLGRQELTDKRTKLLENLLKQHGDTIFDLPTGGVDEKYIAAIISDAGKTDDASADYFVIPTGRLQVSDSAATFRPSSPGDILRVTSTDPQPAGNALSSEDIEKVMTTMPQAPGAGTLNPAQLAALRKYLADPTQELSIRSATAQKLPQITAYAQDADSTMLYSDRGGWIMMDTNGNVTGSPRRPAAMWGAKGGRSGTPLPRSVMTLTAIENGTSALLSVALLVISIFVLRYHPRSRKWVLWYVYLKLLSVGVGAIAMFQLMHSAQIWSSGGASAGAIVYTGIALAFPILVLILMNLRSVRNYYVSVGG